MEVGKDRGSASGRDASSLHKRTTGTSTLRHHAEDRYWATTRASSAVSCVRSTTQVTGLSERPDTPQKKSETFLGGIRMFVAGVLLQGSVSQRKRPEN